MHIRNKSDEHRVVKAWHFGVRNVPPTIATLQRKVPDRKLNQRWAWHWPCIGLVGTSLSPYCSGWALKQHTTQTKINKGPNSASEKCVAGGGLKCPAINWTLLARARTWTASLANLPRFGVRNASCKLNGATRLKRVCLYHEPPGDTVIFLTTMTVERKILYESDSFCPSGLPAW